MHQHALVEPECSARLAALPGWVWELEATSWEENFAALKAYVDREGHARVPQTFRTEDGRRLGRWVSKQRKDYRGGKLAPERSAHWAALPDWVWDVGGGWEENFAALEAYVAREGHARVPATSEIDGRTLGTWVSKQRQAYRQGTSDPERSARLEALAGWVWKAPVGRGKTK